MVWNSGLGYYVNPVLMHLLRTLKKQKQSRSFSFFANLCNVLRCFFMGNRQVAGCKPPSFRLRSLDLRYWRADRRVYPGYALPATRQAFNGQWHSHQPKIQGLTGLDGWTSKFIDVYCRFWARCSHEFCLPWPEDPEDKLF